MSREAIDQMRSMVEFSAGVGELLKERDELLKATIHLVEHIWGTTMFEFLSTDDRMALQPAMIAIARARDKSTFGNDWMGALE